MAEEHVEPLVKIRRHLVDQRREAALEIAEIIEQSNFIPDRDRDKLVETHRLISLIDEMIESERSPRKPTYNLPALG